MFGLVNANIKELSKEQRRRYGAVYCGICRAIRQRTSQTARLGLQYDMAFLALLLMSLYEPREEQGKNVCIAHPLCPRPWVDNAYVRYAADMNIALAYYKAADDYADEGHLSAKVMRSVFGKELQEIARRYPRQCQAMEACISRLSVLEKGNCPSADETANCFGTLMAELMVYEEDLWASTLRKMGMALGRFIYLADAALDYRKDVKKGAYNPFVAMDTGLDWPRWENYLVLAMGSCTAAFEKLPLVQDKQILDNILYSGVWCALAHMKKKEKEEGQ